MEVVEHIIVYLEKNLLGALNNSNSILLNKYYELCKKVYPNFEWKIYDTLQSSGVKKN